MQEYLATKKTKITVATLAKMKAEGKKISMLTSYDYTTAKIVDEAGVDAILIGDSASNVMAGNSTTLPITLEQMIYHASCVARAAEYAFVICDMPFGSYQISPEDAARNAIRIIKESGCNCVKIEGGARVIDVIKRVIDADIPVFGHLGLTPQSINKFGSYSIRAKEETEAEQLLSDVALLAEAGCCGIVLEKIPAELTAKACSLVNIPIIGIGAGAADGQVLVIDDMLGKNKGFSPKFLRRYADLYSVMMQAIKSYVSDVQSGDFPNEQEHY